MLPKTVEYFSLIIDIFTKVIKHNNCTQLKNSYTDNEGDRLVSCTESFIFTHSEIEDFHFRMCIVLVKAAGLMVQQETWL